MTDARGIPHPCALRQDLHHKKRRRLARCVYWLAHEPLLDCPKTAHFSAQNFKPESWHMTWAPDQPWLGRRKSRRLCGADAAGGGCQVQAEPGKARCRFHGGKSTGPKTQAGRARIAEAQRLRWRAYRARYAGS